MVDVGILRPNSCSKCLLVASKVPRFFRSFSRCHLTTSFLCSSLYLWYDLIPFFFIDLLLLLLGLSMLLLAPPCSFLTQSWMVDVGILRPNSCSKCLLVASKVPRFIRTFSMCHVATLFLWSGLYLWYVLPSPKPPPPHSETLLLLVPPDQPISSAQVIIWSKYVLREVPEQCNAPHFPLQS